MLVKIAHWCTVFSYSFSLYWCAIQVHHKSLWKSWCWWFEVFTWWSYWTTSPTCYNPWERKVSSSDFYLWLNNILWEKICLITNWRKALFLIVNLVPCGNFLNLSSTFPCRVTGLKIELLGETSIASTISYLDNAFVYIGSSYGDSQVCWCIYSSYIFEIFFFDK